MMVFMVDIEFLNGKKVELFFKLEFVLKKVKVEFLVIEVKFLLVLVWIEKNMLDCCGDCLEWVEFCLEKVFN